MEFQGISDITEGFSQQENSDEGEFSLEVGKEKVDSLKKSIVELNELISERETLSKSTFNDAEKIKTEINNFLLENEANQVSDPESKDNTKEKNDLRHKKIEISEFQLNEKIGCWKDIALLKKERRIYEQELNEKLARTKMLQSLMNSEGGN